MLQRTIEVYGLNFTQVDIFGCYLPLRTSIESVLDKITDKRNKRKICEHANKLTILHSQEFDIPHNFQHEYICKVGFRVKLTNENHIYNLKKKSLIIMGYQCALANCKFDYLAQSRFTVKWFEGVVGGFDHDIQKMRKISGHWLRCIRGQCKYFEEYADLKPEPPSKRINEYPEYIVANTIGELFNARIHEIAHYDKRMCVLLYEELQIMNEVFQRIEKIEGKICTTVCTKCYMPFTSKQVSSLKVCSSCQNKRREEKKVNRRIDRKGWEFDRVGICDGGCGSSKINTNTYGSCLKCYCLNY
jgi:hypothetical protein